MLYLVCNTMFAVPIETNMHVIFGLSCYVGRNHRDKFVCYIWLVMLGLLNSYIQPYIWFVILCLQYL